MANKIKSCEWTCYEPHDGDYFEGHETECGHNFLWFEDGDVEYFKNRELTKGVFKFCPYCGGEIVENAIRIGYEDDGFERVGGE